MFIYLNYLLLLFSFLFFFFNDTATTEIYTLSLHDALPILLWLVNCDSARTLQGLPEALIPFAGVGKAAGEKPTKDSRSEEHTSELQSRQYLVCRLLLEKKKKKIQKNHRNI